MAETVENSTKNGDDESPEISWNPDPQPLRDIQSDALPCVCRLSTDGTTSLPGGMSLYCKQPLYLHHRRQRRQVLGRTIYHDPSGPYYEVGQTLILPDNFEG